MIKISAPPPGYYNSGEVNIGNTDTNGQFGGGANISLAPKKNLNNTSGSPEYYFSILRGTTLLDSIGKILVGNISYEYTRHEFNANYPGFYRNGINLISIAKYLSASFQLYVTPIGGVKTTVKKFGNGGGITFTSPVPIGLINDETNAPFNIGEQISRWETNLLFFNPTNSLPSTKLPISLLNGVKVVKDTLKNMINYSMNYTYGSSLPAMVYNTHIDLKGIVLNTNAMVECEVISNYKLINTVYFNFNNPTGTKAFDISGVACANKPLEFRLANFNPEYIMTFDPDRFSGISQVVTVTEPILDPNVVTVNVDLSVVKKSNHSLAIKPNAYISIGVNELMPIALSDGKVTLKIKLDKTYILHAPLGSSYGIGQLSVTEVGNDYVATIILSIGSALGTEYSFTTPKNANKVVDLNYIIPVADADFNQMK